MPLILMQKENARRVTGDLFGVSAFAACTPFTRFKGYYETKRIIPVIPRTWLIPRESFMMLHTFHFNFHFL